MKSLEVIQGDAELLDAYLHNPCGTDTKYTEDRTGWYFGSGNPEFWHLQDRMLVPGGELLDVGIGTARSSMFFALHGMDVTGIDPDNHFFDDIAELGHSLGVDIKTFHGKLEEAALPHESFDTVLLDSTLIHNMTKTEALELLGLSYEHVKPGGHIWARASGIEDYNIYQLFSAAKRGYQQRGAFAMPFPGEIIDDYTVSHECGCSGELKMDTSVCFEQVELQTTLASLGAMVVHSQCIPQEGTHNVMYGEDWNRDHGYTYQSGAVTVLAQKPLHD